MTTNATIQPMTTEELESIEQAHVGDYLGHGWTQDYIESDGDEPAYYRVATPDTTVVATMPDWAGGVALFLAEAHDAVPKLIAEITRLRTMLADREDGIRKLRALEAYGVDNWEGYCDALNGVEY